ncbi:uncharacterized protein LOC144073357 [Stigmatopora argus]
MPRRINKKSGKWKLKHGSFCAPGKGRLKRRRWPTFRPTASTKDSPTRKKRKMNPKDDPKPGCSCQVKTSARKRSESMVKSPELSVNTDSDGIPKKMVKAQKSKRTQTFYSAWRKRKKSTATKSKPTAENRKDVSYGKKKMSDETR